MNFARAQAYGWIDEGGKPTIVEGFPIPVNGIGYQTEFPFDSWRRDERREIFLISSDRSGLYWVGGFQRWSWFGSQKDFNLIAIPDPITADMLPWAAFELGVDPVRARWTSGATPSYRFNPFTDDGRAKNLLAGKQRDKEAADARDAAGSFVYFIQGEKGGLIKIGKAVNPEKRLSALQSGSTERLVLLAITPGGHRLERKLHRQFEQYRVHGEWFTPSPELLSLIAELTK